jgi:hypothetical protein
VRGGVGTPSEFPETIAKSCPRFRGEGLFLSVLITRRGKTYHTAELYHVEKDFTKFCLRRQEKSFGEDKIYNIRIIYELK